MPLPTVDQLQHLGREELIALLGQQAEQIVLWTEQVRQLTETVERLQAENERLKHPPAGASSQNSSQPPSRDWKADGLPGQGRRKKKPGAQPGHPKAARSLVAKPDAIIEARVTTCRGCGADLHSVTPERVVRRQVTELPLLKPVVIETQQHEVCCPACELRQAGSLPAGLEAGRAFGPRLEALIAYLHQVHHMGFERLQGVLADVLGVSLSTGGEVAVVERAGLAAEPEAATIGAQVGASPVIQSDETSARVNGRNYWEWVFVSQAGVYHLIRHSRGQDVIDEFMGTERQAEAWVSDCWKPQLNAPAKQHQICLPHQLRALQGLLDRRPHLLWARQMQGLFREAIHLGHRRDRLTAHGFQRQVTLLERRLDRLLQRSFTGLGTNLLDRYRTHQAHLFVFLHRTDVPADNNACERALRPSVIHRKVMGSFRSEWGAHAYAALATVLDTAKRAGLNLFQKLVSLMGQPILHFLQPAIP